MKISPRVRRQLFLSILFFASSVSTFAQIPGLEWAKIIGALEIEQNLEAMSATTDLSGNVYTSGGFLGRIDFDPGAGTYELQSNGIDGFVTKLDANGNFVWAIQLTTTFSTAGTSITIDEDGNIVIAGYFGGTTDFDPGPGFFELSAQGEFDGFVLKLSPNGDFIFAKKFGGADYEFVRDVHTDLSNNIYVTGFFEGTADFDPSDGVFELTSVGDSDAFLCKLDSDGNFDWVKSYGEFNNSDGIAVEVDFAGDVYIMGELEDSDGLGNNEVFINKLDAAGNSLWYKSIGGSDPMSVHSLQTDASGAIYFAGTFDETQDFDPDATTFELAGDDDFICKWDSDGTFVWAKVLGFSGLNCSAQSMDVDINGNIFFTGYFFVKVDMDPGPGVANIYTAYSDDPGMFVLKLDNNGDYVWAQGFNSVGGGESGGEENGNFITTDVAGNIYVLGIFSNTVNFSTGICTPSSLTTDESSSFILKLAPTSVPPTCFGIIEQPAAAVACQDEGTFLVALGAGTSRIAYRWQKFDGTDWIDIYDQEPDEESSLEGYEGSDTPYFIVTSVVASGSGDFRCKISGDFVSDAFSDVITLTYFGSTAIPFVVANSGCGPGRYLITASGASEGEYQWYEDGELIDGAVNSIFTTPYISSSTVYSVSKSSGDCSSDRVEVFVNTNACTPVPGLVWAAQPQTTTGDVHITKMVADASGNSYSVGYFTGTVDFDTGPGSAILSTAIADERENFILKLDADREVVWVQSLNFIGNTIQLSLDGQGSIYLAGLFMGTLDFDPSASVFSMTATGNRDMFITKLDTDGNFVWAKRMGGTGSAFINPRSVAADANGVYTTGDFSGTIDFDPNVGVLNRTSAGSTLFRDIFICKLDPDGNIASGLGWAHRMGATSATDAGVAIKVDASGNVYSTGRFFGASTDFDPGPGIFTLPAGGATDFYIHKLNNAGIFQWAATLGGAGVEIPYALALDAVGNPHIATTFGDEMVLLKYTADGALTWTKTMGGFASEPTDLTVDVSGNVLMTGFAQGNDDFDPGPDIFVLPSRVNLDAFVVQLDTNGDFSWAFNLGSTGLSYFSNRASSIGIDSDGSIYIAGSFSHASDLDPGHCTFPIYASNGNSYIQKVKPGIATLCFNLQPLTVAGCTGATETISALAAGTTNIAYQWQKLNTGTSLYEDITDIGGYTGTTTTDLSIDTNGNFGAGNYQCKVTGDNAPDEVSNQISVTVNAIPSSPMVTGSTSCTAESQTLTASGSTNGNYRWYDVPTDGTAIELETNENYLTPVITETTSYYVSIADAFCESERTEVIATVNYISAPILSVNGNLIFCEGGSTELLAPSGFVSYAWSSGQSTEVILATTTGSYSVIVTDSDGCTSEPSSPIDIVANLLPAKPIIAHSSPTSFCEGGSVQLNAPPGFTGYLWSTTETTEAILVDATGVFSVVVTDANGCASVASDNIVITENVPPAQPVITIQGNATACIGESVSLTAPIGFTYLWSTTETTQQISVTTAGNYTVTITDSNNCSSVASAPIAISFTTCVTNQPPVIATSSLITAIGSLVTLNLATLISDPDDNLDLSTLRIVSQPQSGALASIDGNFNLVLDYNGVSFSGVEEIVIEVCDLLASCVQQTITIEVIGDVVIYNALSPNNDGLNDYFIIQYIDALPESNQVTIYNRWGDVVFEISDYDNDTRVFKGLNNNGKELPSGTYFYKIQFASGRSSKSGYISLKR